MNEKNEDEWGTAVKSAPKNPCSRPDQNVIGTINSCFALPNCLPIIISCEILSMMMMLTQIKEEGDCCNHSNIDESLINQYWNVCNKSLLIVFVQSRGT